MKQNTIKNFIMKQETKIEIKIHLVDYQITQEQHVLYI